MAAQATPASRPFGSPALPVLNSRIATEFARASHPLLLREQPLQARLTLEPRQLVPRRRANIGNAATQMASSTTVPASTGRQPEGGFNFLLPPLPRLSVGA
jgi:hypothetical protein